MTNKEKATNILAIIMEELNVPAKAPIGDIIWNLQFIDETGEIEKMLKFYIREAVIDDIKEKIEKEGG